MKMILGILQPTTGTVIVGDKRIGKDVDFLESAGAIIETIEFIPYMSAYQNLADIAAMRGNLSKTQIKEVLEMVGLEMSEESMYQSFPWECDSAWQSHRQ